MWFGLRNGLTYDQAMDLPLSLILDLVAVQAIEEGGAERKMRGEDAKASLLEISKLR
ncbi:MAG: hypothetical protein J6T26_03645 [Firmicutes bacterium]|nr:hypothetical protein [Bacillota bacterium]